MAIYKCKMCSGELDVREGVSVIECDYCGTKQTVPTAKDENLQGLFNRANILRMKSEFDKAEQIYEKILQADESQAEAYWGLILCKYGIEYVEDPKTFTRIPTCHRTSFDSIIADDDYKSALQYADGVQRGIYEAEAKEIDRLQKEILALSQKEEPYDVFICYKETDDTGRRTQDSAIANDIYYQLTNQGFKVFYAAITLEDKLGSAYEPCIFAALNSAKVMLAVGTKPEFFSAVWVKNEWSRFLKMMKNDRNKNLIPCYKDMDAYELPEEFAHLQAQDMSKIGFINDIVRGITKLIGTTESGEDSNSQKYTVSATREQKSLLKRIYAFLEDEEWEKADEYTEKLLDLDADFADAYLCKLLIEFECDSLEFLAHCTGSVFDEEDVKGSKNYRKFIKNASQKQIKEVDELFRQRALEREEYEQEKKKKAEEALLKQDKISELEEERKVLRKFKNILSCQDDYVIGVKADGTCLAAGNNEHGKCNVSDWENIREIYTGRYTIGLKDDGTCICTNKTWNERLSEWTSLQKIAMGWNVVIGIKTDGTCVMAKEDEEVNFDVSNWTNIADIIITKYGVIDGVIGLRKDGTCIVDGELDESLKEVIESWDDLIEIKDYYNGVLALKKNGAVLRIDGDHQSDEIETDCIMLSTGWGDNIISLGRSNWAFENEKILSLSGCSFLVALKEDGSVIVYNSTYLELMETDPDYFQDFGQWEVKNWKLFDNYLTYDQEREQAKKAREEAARKAEEERRATEEAARKAEEERRAAEEAARKKAEEERRAAERLAAQRRSQGLCQHCGGELKGFFSKKCTSCGKPKDY